MYRLTPAVQSYDWGSPTAIPQFAGWAFDGSPVAEAWFGTHVSAPSSIAGSDAPGSLRDRVTAAPAEHLGAGIVERFGDELPFLLKLIAPARPLSLQVHPSLGQAALGWVQEQRVGVPLDAPHRTYKDPNHKPEMIYALSTFEAVSGFRAPRRALEVLAGLEAPLLSGTIERLRHGSSTQGMRSAFEYLLLGAKDRDEDVCALVDQIRARRDAGASPSDHADSIALTIAEHYPHDRGALASLLLNPVTLQPGEAMFVPAGSPHAYLSGLGVELMISVSDPTPGVNTPVVVTVTDLVGAETATATVTSQNPAIPDSAIEIAGVAALTKDVVDESVTFTFRFATDGVYTTKITTDNGIEIPAQVITVGAGDSTGGGSGDSADSGSKLPVSGSNGMVGMAALGGGLFLAGGVGLYLVRRNNQKAV